MSASITLHQLAEQPGPVITRYVGFLSAKDIAALMDDAITLNPNPRSPTYNRIARDIEKTLEKHPDCFKYMSKGTLFSCSVVEHSGEKLTLDLQNGGILDGGHNFFAICRYLLQKCVKSQYPGQKKFEVEAKKKVEGAKDWDKLVQAWSEYGKCVDFALKAPGAKNLKAFELPAEFLTPATEVREKDFRELIQLISVARNNNVQLKAEAIAQQKGSYELLRLNLPPAINDKVQWKSGQPGRTISSTHVVRLAIVPLWVLQHNGVLYNVQEAVNKMLGAEKEGETLTFDQLSLQAIYSSATKSISQYSQVIDAVTNLDPEEPTRQSVVKSLGVIAELPALWDAIEYAFEQAYDNAVSGNPARKKFQDFNCNRDGKTGEVKALKTLKPTRFFTLQMGIGSCAPAYGFITPLFVALATALMQYNPRASRVEWRYNMETVIDGIKFGSPGNVLEKVMPDYIDTIEEAEYNPQNVGKTSAYTMLIKLFSARL